jgi:phosphinothricin acetyltransferase
MSKVKIRLATPKDGEAILNIYKWYIENTAITFETEVPSAEAFGQRIENTLTRYPWLVCEVDGAVAGYAYASKHRERAAYQWSADFSIYVNEKYHRRHIAKALYQVLEEILRLQGYYTVFAGVTTPNPKSEAFHAAYGFDTVGVFENVGYKSGQWRDVKWFKYTLADYQKEPIAPKGFPEVTDTEALDKILKDAEELIDSCK